MSDPRAAQAREAHRLSNEKAEEAGRQRQIRDRLIRQLREDDPSWSYGRLAVAVGCSPELIAHIIKDR